jgi:mannosyl-oligosaccharide glucosidase
MARADITTTTNNSLLSFVPSRSIFPRGFLWDEGFHLLPILEWEFDLPIRILKNWLKTMDADGWIPRRFMLP